MWKSADRELYIDMRSDVDIMQSGALNNVDARISYVGCDMDEWSDLYKTFLNPANNLFLHSVNELVMDHGLNRANAIRLVSSSYRRGLLAANILSVAGYGNVVIEVGRQRDCAYVPTAIVNDRNCNCVWDDERQLTNAISLHEGGWLH
jgi:hypothetical protein